VEVTCKNTGPCEARISFAIPREDFDKALDQALTESGRNVRMKGFRPGKVPRSFLEKQFGPDARRQVVEHFSQQAFRQAVEENDLKPIGRRPIDLEGVDFDTKEGLEHQFDVSLRPTIELGDYKGLEIASELAPVLEEELDAALEDFRRQNSTPEPVAEEGLPSDGVAGVSMKWERNGEVIFEREGLHMSPASAPPGIEADAFKEALTGTQVGDERELSVAIPEDLTEVDEEHRGEEATCHITITEAFKIVPPTDEDIAKMLESEDFAAAREVARKNIQEAREHQEMHRQGSVLLQQVIAAHEFELPASMLDDQVSAHTQQVTMQLTEKGLGPEEVEAEVAKQAESVRNDVQQGLKELFLVRELAERESLEITQEDLNAEFAQIAQRNQASMEEVVSHYRENQHLIEQLSIEITQRKVCTFLRENANIQTPS